MPDGSRPAVISRAWSTVVLKATTDSAGKRTFSGIATTPSTDRMGDVVESKGAQFKLPIPLLWQHDSGDPIGWVTSAKVTTAGIQIEGEVAAVAEAGQLRDRLDMAWQMLQAGLVRGLSIGFVPVEMEPIDAKNPWGAQRFTAWDWLELSAVTIPANADASITSIKSIDHRLLAATGHKQHVVVRLDGFTPASGLSKTTPSDKGKTVDIQKQIESFKAKQMQLQNERKALMEKAGDEGRSLDKEEAERFDAAGEELEQTDLHLKRLDEMQKADKAAALPVDPTPGRKGDMPRIVMGEKKLDKGIAFTRLVMLLGATKGNLPQAVQMAEDRFKDSSPEVVNVLRAASMQGSMSALMTKTAVAAGTTQDSTWASPLAQANVMASEFIEYLRPRTIMGQFGANGIPALRAVPFNIKIQRQTGGTSGMFVGEGLPKPVSKMAFELITMPFAKIATIVVLTDELVRLSNPAAEALAREDLANGVAAYEDSRFIDPTFAGVANVSPAAITYNADGSLSGGVTLAAIDASLKAAIQSLSANNLNLANLVWIMNPAKAISLSMLRTTNGPLAYPEITAKGGTLLGFPVITSNNVALSGSPTDSFVVLCDPSNILLADDGQIAIDVSTEASLQMVDNPQTGAQSLVSLFQNNLVAFRAERYCYWMLRHAHAVYVINNVDW